MIGVCLLALVSCATAAITKAPPTGTTVTINPKLRKALLEALSSYDGEESTEAGDEATTFSTDFPDDSTDSPFVKIHTFAIDGDKSDENEVIKTIIITRPKTTLTPPREPSNDLSDRSDNVQIKFNKVPDPVAQDDDKSDNIQVLRSVVEPRNNVKKEEKTTKKKASEKSVTKPITPLTPTTTTTTTLPPPVTNADGVNIEKVAKEDVQISQAPLLAAFTVQQDVNGQPKKVIQLFKNPQQNENSKKIINQEFRASQSLSSVAPTFPPSSTVELPKTTPSQDFQGSGQNFQGSNQQQQLLSSFELKQRQLEEQIRFLQARQREQDEIIRRHQLLQDQQNRQQSFEQQRLRIEEDQRQRQRFDEEQRQRERFQQEQNFLIRQQQSQVVQQPQTQVLQAPTASTPNVQFIPSIPVSHTVGISVEQQLPFKGPVEFNPDNPELQKTFNQQKQNFQFRQQFQNPFQLQQQSRNAGFGQQQLPLAQSLIQQQEVRQIQGISPLPINLELPVRQPQAFNQFSPLPTNLELPQKQFQTFNSAPLSVLPSITEIAPQGEQRTRVFRNDASQTGNFGTFHIQQQQIDPVNFSIDNQLQNLLRQSGINTRSTDDFGIISKILSLNHGIPNQFFRPNQGNQGRFQ